MTSTESNEKKIIIKNCKIVMEEAQKYANDRNMMLKNSYETLNIGGTPIYRRSQKI